MLMPVGKTDVGRVRDINQDAFEVGLLEDGTAWVVVCDGMGGANGGQVASGCAVEKISGSIRGGYLEQMSGQSLKYLLVAAVSAANVIIHDLSMENAELSGMGTTVVAVIVKNGVAHIASAGDSRAYHIARLDGIEQVTRDHSMVQYLVDSGQLSEEEARHHPRKNLITRALGVEEEIEVDYREVDAEAGDFLLICTDGLTNVVEDAELCELVLSCPVEEAATRMIELANGRGGPDNITVVLLSC